MRTFRACGGGGVRTHPVHPPPPWLRACFNRIRTRDLRDTGAMLYQLSCEATRWERGQFVEFISFRQYHYVPIRGSLRVVGLLEGGL